MKLLSVVSAARAIDTSKHTIYKAINAGELRWVNVATGDGKRARVRIDEDDLRAWVNSRKTAPLGRAS